MQVSLKTMDNDAYCDYLQQALPAYAKDNIESGRWQKSDALARAQQAFQRLLPKGLKTENNYLFNIIADESSTDVGYIWVKIEENIDTKSAFIYDLEIYENQRRKGYGKSALACIEEVISTLGANSLGLHVFKHNAAAMALYNSIGYQVVSHNMQKNINH